LFRQHPVVFTRAVPDDACGLSLLGPFAEIWVYTAVLMAALPPALNVFVFARQYDVWVEQASSAVLFGTLISVATLTSVMWLVKTQQLPVGLFH
jgi:predicted permease